MISRVQNIFVVLICICIIAVSCSKPEGDKAKIIQSNFVYEDNVNGRIPPPNNVIESTNFYYNDNGTLNSATVYDDTTASAHLLKEINVTYANDKIILNTFLDTIGDVTYTVTFNDKKQVLSITLPDSSGLHLSYFNDRISSIKIMPSGDEYLSFIYDDNDNLLQYDLKVSGFVIGRAVLEYNNDLIGVEFDSRFFTKDIKFIYLGGLDLMTKLGLNYGRSTQNKLIKRTEINLLSGQVVELYNYGYTLNNRSDIVKRNIRFTADTLYYQFKY